jgi:hypothetical protein
MKMPLVARVAHTRLLLEAVKFSSDISGQKWLLLVDLMERILMKVVSTAVDG